MRRTAAVFTILLLVFASCLIAGCSLPSFSGSPGSFENGGISSGQDTIITKGRYPLEDVLQYVLMQNWLSGEGSSGSGAPEKHIKYIHGIDLGERGDAAIWMIVVEQGGSLFMVTFKDEIGSASATPNIPSWTTIDTKQIIYPNALFEKHHALVFNASQTGPVSRSISLDEGNYIVTLSGKNEKQTLVFNATTGALIS